jgi:hypothetical protein
LAADTWRHLAAFRKPIARYKIELILNDRNLDLIEGIDVAVRIGPLADSNVIAKRAGEVRRVWSQAQLFQGAPKEACGSCGSDVLGLPGRSPEWRFRRSERRS